VAEQIRRAVKAWIEATKNRLVLALKGDGRPQPRGAHVAEPSGASINIPQWDGQAQRCAVLWELQKGAHKAVCALYTHPIGAAIRAFVDDELWRPKYPVSTAWRISMVPAVWRYAAGAVGPAAICWSAYYCWAVPSIFQNS
jgi:hypothetical protein